MEQCDLSFPSKWSDTCSHRGKPNHTTTGCEFKRQWRHRELFLCSGQGWLTGSSSQKSRTRALLIPRCCYLSTHHHFTTPGCLNMKNNPLVFLLHILALPSASHLACYQPLLWTQVATTSGSLTNWNLWLWSCSDSRPTVGASWCWKAKKDHVNVFFFPTVQTGVCKTTQFMPWVPFHQPSHQCQAKLPLPGERKSSEWVKKGVWSSMALCQPQGCIHEPAVPSTAEPPGPQAQLWPRRVELPHTWEQHKWQGEAVPPPARAQDHGTQASTFSHSITNTAACPSTQRCLKEEVLNMNFSVLKHFKPRSPRNPSGLFVCCTTS